MRLTRYVGFIDLGIAAVVLVMIVLPPREMYAAAAQKGSEADQFALALAEAKTVARPSDSAAVGEYARRLTAVGFRDWAVEAAIGAQEHTRGQPGHWRTLLATSLAYIDRFDVDPALEYAKQAVAFCQDASRNCPGWEIARMKLYRDHLQGSKNSGINPWRDPEGFRKAGEKALLGARLIPSQK
jgi:hypothetical protein